MGLPFNSTNLANAGKIERIVVSPKDQSLKRPDGSYF